MTASRSTTLFAFCLSALAATQAAGNNEIATALQQQQHRHLKQAKEEKQGNPGANCGKSIGSLIACYGQKCVTEFCDIQPGVVPDAPPDSATAGCDALTEGFCSSFNVDCCPACAAETSEYLECIVESSFLQNLCPGASCTVGALPDPNATIPEWNMTNATESNVPEPMPEVEAGSVPGEEIADVDAPAQSESNFLSGFCGMEIATVFGCYLSQCADRECNSALDTVDPAESEEATIEDCQEFEGAFCLAFAAADNCCPECKDATLMYSTCALKQQVSQFCPGASCDGTRASKTGTYSKLDANNNGDTEYTSSSSGSGMASSGFLAAMGLMYLLL